MFSRVQPSLLSPRLDADFYKNEFISNEAHLKDFGVKRLAQLIDVKASGYCVLPSSNEYCDGGVPLIRGGDLSFGEVVSPSVFAPLSYKNGKGTALDGDVLILIKGACIDGPEGVARVKQDNHGNLFNGSCFRLAFDNREIDGPFFIAYSQSKFFLKQKKRQVANTGISYNDEDSIHGYLVPELEESTKKYIGDKVRQAEQLRAWAKRLEDAVYRYHSQFIPDQDHLDFNKKNRMVSVKRMTERLDAHFYPGVVEQYLIAHPGKFESVRALTSAIYNGQTQPESSEEFCEQITVAHLSASFVKGKPRKVKAPAKNNKFVKPHDILMCNAAHNKSYIGRDLTYVHTDKKLLPSTEVMTIRIDRDQVPASYVRAYLLSRLGYVKIQSTIRGITAHSYPDDVALLDIYIPEVEPSKKDEWFKQDDLLVQAGFAVELAQLLTSSAKTLVEALIEGQLTEQQLIQAQQALDDGDNSLDQAILSKLSSEGYAIEGATPLFSDIDELYRLLESAAHAEAEE